MRITKVSVDGDIDEFGGRALVVNTDSEVGSFKTPNRALNSQELRYKAKMPFKPPINNSISEMIGQFYGKNWTNFTETNTNKSFDERQKTMGTYSVQMAYTIKRFYPQIASGTAISKRIIDRFILLQRFGGLDFISMPSVPYNDREFDNKIEYFIDDVLSEKEEPLIYLDMGLDTKIFENRFTTLLDLAESGIIHSIGLIYKAINAHIDNYLFLKDKRDAEVFLQMSDVPREHHGPQSTSTMHLLQKFGVDSFSVKMGNAFRDKDENEEETKPKPIQAIKRLDSVPLVFRQFKTWEDHENSFDCKCAICAGKSVEDFISTYRGRYEEYPGQTFDCANRLHEYYCSSDEFASSRDYIRSGELREYFKNKEGLNASDILTPRRSKSLFDF
jgi:hypothetical protein